MKTKSAPVRDKLIARLAKKCGINNCFRITDLQREIVEMHGLDYREAWKVLKKLDRKIHPCQH